MKLYKPNKAEWLTFIALSIPLVAALNYIFYGSSRFFSGEVLLISYPLLIAMVFISWYLHVLAQEAIRKKLMGVQQSFRRLLVLEIVHFLMTAASFVFFFWLYDRLSIFGYQFKMQDYWVSLLVALTLSLIATAVWEGYFIFKNFRKSMVEKEQLQRISYQEELNALKSQVNPHFLFNSLNSLSSLIGDDPKKAEAFLDEMSKVYRYLLRNNNVELTNLATELKFIRSYIHLLETRYGASIHFEMNVKSSCEECLIPPLTLQLLVENAVKHNVTLKEKPLTITIETDGEGRLTIRNNLQRKTMGVSSTKIGLKNIIERYKLLDCGEVQVVDDGRFFSVSLPLVKPGEVTGSFHATEQSGPIIKPVL